MRALLLTGLLVVGLLLAGCIGPTTPEGTASRAPDVVDHVAPPPASRSEDPGPCTDRWPCAPFEGGEVPRFATALHMDLANVTKVSRFRSGFGHDYSMGTDESCRSLKHYFVPRFDIADWPNVTIASPATGRIVSAETEHSGMGAQVWIEPMGHPSFRIILFHVVLDEGVREGTRVDASERIGHHVGNMTANDVAILMLTPEGPRFLPYSDVLTDEAWASFAARGVAREDLVIDRAWRDANLMECEGERFVGGDTSRDWLSLT